MKSNVRIRILVVDDHPIVRAGLASVIGLQSDMEIVGQAGNAREALEIHAQTSPDVTLMDLKLPGMSGVEAIRVLRQRRSGVKVVVLTTYEGDEDIYQALLAGAAAYITKAMPLEMLLQGIREVYQGKEYLLPEVSQAVENRSAQEDLSARERQVLTLIAKGQSNLEIAAELGITEGTVKCHVGVILSHFSVKDRTQAVIVAARRGFVRI